MTSKYNLEINRLDPSNGLEDGMASVENSLTRTEKIISDIDKRIGNIDTSTTNTYWASKDFGGDITLTTTDTKYIEFQNLSEGKYYRVTFNFELYIDPYISGSIKDFAFWIRVRSTDSAGGNSNVETRKQEYKDYQGGSTSSHALTERAIYITTSRSYIYKNLHVNGKVALWIQAGSSGATHKVKNADNRSYMTIEELPNHKETTKWD